MVDSIALEDCHYIGTIMAVASIPFPFDIIKNLYVSPIKFTCSVALLVPFLVCYKVAGLIGIINPPFFLNYLALFPFERPKRASCELDSQSW